MIIPEQVMNLRNMKVIILKMKCLVVLSSFFFFGMRFVKAFRLKEVQSI